MTTLVRHADFVDSGFDLFLSDFSAERRDLVMGPFHGDGWVVEKGLGANEAVIVDGVQKVQAGMPVEEGRKALHDLIDAKIPAMWLYPETDYICSFAPFNNLPTQYRISVDGVQKWFGQ